MSSNSRESASLQDTDNEKIKTNDQLLKYKRENYQRIFVNRNVVLDRISYFGFDMDYTLAEYISPAYECLTFKYALERLIEIGYPQDIASMEYRTKFATRGVVYDNEYGNFLKIDPYGTIMIAIHGFSCVDNESCKLVYKNRFIDVSDAQRFSIFNTLFEIPAMCMIASVIDYFEKSPAWKHNMERTGMESESVHVSYRTIYDDVVETFDYVHYQKNMKQETIDHFSTYIKKDDRIALLLKRIRDSGRKTFLVTNSNYWYTDNVMNSLIKGAKKHGPAYSENWRDYFDVIFVEAKKPRFFVQGTSMSQIDVNTGKKHIGVFKGIQQPGDVFAGGNSEILCEILGANGKDILYVGDHIFGDILKSKKKQGWRTYLVVPELKKEMYMWIENKDKYDEISRYENKLSNTYRNMDSGVKTRPEAVGEYVQKIKDTSIEIEKTYGKMGSLLRSGFRQTFFAGQLARFADLYSYTCFNLLNYPFFYVFRAPHLFLPHEATLNLEERNKITENIFQPILSTRSYEDFEYMDKLRDTPTKPESDDNDFY